MSPSTQAACCLSLAALSAAGWFFFQKQSRPGRMGGSISRAKMLWLLYVLYLWFLLCPILYFEESLLWPLRRLLLAVSLLMWLRGIAELAMMYVLKNWRPPYGIAHDLLCLAVLGAGLWLHRGDWAGVSGADAWTLGLLCCVELTFALEAIYALAFYRIVGEGTKGEKAIWFAPQGDPIFGRVVLLTAVCNIPLCAFLVSYLLFCVIGFGS
jgi:hypothetical protein